MQTLKGENSGFSMMEIMLVVVLLSVLIAGVIVAVNPADQFARARNTERIAHIREYHETISRKIAVEGLSWNCVSGPFPQEIDEGEPVFLEIGSGANQYNLCQCLVPVHMQSFSVDPLVGNIDNPRTCAGSYSSGYEIWQNSLNNKIILRAPHAERGEVIGTNLEELENF